MTADHKIKNSRSLLLSLAEQRGLAGLLHGDSPLSFGDRFEIRHQLDQAARQKNLETIVSLASENCSDEVGNELASLMTESTPADYRSELQELLAPLGQLSQK